MLLVSMAVHSASAQNAFPERTVRILVGYVPGGPNDIIARAIGDKLAQAWDRSVVVENVPGASGNIAGDRVAKAAPDGYTMVMGNLGSHAASVGLYKNLSYDPRIDFEPVMLVASTPMVLVVRKNLQTDTLKEFIAYAAANPHKVTFGSAGTGSGSHLTYLLFTHLTKLEIQHVPYRGLSQAVNDLLSGQIDMMFDQLVSATPHILSGGVKPIAVTAPSRAAAIPKVPSSIEAGLPELQTSIWTALFFPKATPKPIVERINAALDKAMRDATVAKRLADLGADLPAAGERTPQALGKLVRDEVDKWVPLIQAAGAAGE
jgi:tripartite-type tricarboxylate transporter receptor subunit TctC